MGRCGGQLVETMMGPGIPRRRRVLLRSWVMSRQQNPSGRSSRTAKVSKWVGRESTTGARNQPAVTTSGGFIDEKGRSLGNRTGRPV